PLARRRVTGPRRRAAVAFGWSMSGTNAAPPVTVTASNCTTSGAEGMQAASTKPAATPHLAWFRPIIGPCPLAQRPGPDASRCGTGARLGQGRRQGLTSTATGRDKAVQECTAWSFQAPNLGLDDRELVAPLLGAVDASLGPRLFARIDPQGVADLHRGSRRPHLPERGHD